LVLENAAVEEILFGYFGSYGAVLAAYSAKTPHRAYDERHGKKIYDRPEDRDEKAADDGVSEKDIYAHIADIKRFKDSGFCVSVADEAISDDHRELENKVRNKQSKAFFKCGNDAYLFFASVISGVEIIHLFFTVFKVRYEHRRNCDRKNNGKYQQ
jgi:hypothetical protein